MSQHTKPGDRIAILYVIISTEIGGTEQQLYNLLTLLDRSRFRPMLAYYQKGGKDADFRAIDDLGVFYLPRSLSRGHMLGTALQLAAVMKRENVQIVHTFLDGATVAGMAGAILAGVPLKIASERTGLVEKKTNPLKELFFGRVTPALTRRADLVIANSRASARRATARGVPESRIHVIYNGLHPGPLSLSAEDGARARSWLKSGGPVVGIASRLHRYKDHRTLLNACRLLVEKHPSLQVLVVGDGPERAALERQSSQLGIRDNVIFTGYQAPAPFISLMDVAALTTNLAEGMPNFVMEAMWLGKPVVATGIGGTAELVLHGETGLLVPPGDVEALAGAIGALFSDPARASRMGELGRQRIAEHFSLEAMVTAHEGLYTEIYRDIQNNPHTARVKSGSR